MPRNASGIYTLPPSNPVVEGTVIESLWANETMSDISTQLNGVITRDGLLAPTNPIAFVSGTSALPGITFQALNSAGLYLTATVLGLAYGGAAMTISSSLINVLRPMAATTLTLSGPINDANQAATKAYVDANSGGGGVSGDYLPLTGGTLTGDVTGTKFFATGSLGSDTQLPTRAQGDGRWLQLAGGTLTGSVTGTTFFASGAMGSGGTQLTTKAYVDSAIAAGGGGSGEFMPISGGTFTGPVAGTTFTASGSITGTTQLTTKSYVDAQISSALVPYMPKSGGQFTGPVTSTSKFTQNGTPSANGDLATKLYVDNAIAGIGGGGGGDGYLPLTGGTLTGSLTAPEIFITGAISAPTHAVTKQYVDGVVSGGGDFMPIAGGTFTGAVAGTTFTASDPITTDNQLVYRSYVTSVLNGYLPLTGGVLTGAVSATSITLSTAITTSTQAATKKYVDDSIAAIPPPNLSGYLPLSGGTLTGDLNGTRFYASNSSITGTTQLTTKAFVDAADALLMPKAGGTFTGQVSGTSFLASGAISGATQLTTKTYVDNAVAGVGSSYLPLSGGTLTGALYGTTSTMQSMEIIAASNQVFRMRPQGGADYSNGFQIANGATSLALQRTNTAGGVQGTLLYLDTNTFNASFTDATTVRAKQFVATPNP